MRTHNYEVVAPGVSVVSRGSTPTYVIAYVGRNYQDARSFRTFKLSGYETLAHAIKTAEEWRGVAVEYGPSVADGLLEQAAKEAAVEAARKQVAAEAALQAARDDVKRAQGRYGHTEDPWWIARSFIAVLMVAVVGCTYTHPSVSEPDLVEKITNGHKVCYYKTGPGRGYAKCCDDCPMHNETLTTTGGKP